MQPPPRRRTVAQKTSRTEPEVSRTSQGGVVGNSWNRSHVPAHAQSRAELESPRALLPYMARWELSPATVLRLRAHAKYRTRSLAAYGRRLLEPERLVHTPTIISSPSSTLVSLERGPPPTLTFTTDSTRSTTNLPVNHVTISA